MVADPALTAPANRRAIWGAAARWALLAVLLYPLYYLLFVVPHLGWIDFNQIFVGVQALWHGHNPYDTLYYYPPWTAVLLAPLMPFPYDPAHGRFEAAQAWFWVNLAAHLGAMVLWLRAIKIRAQSLDGVLLILAGLLFAPTLQALIQGQSVLLLVLAAALLGTPLGRHPLAGGLALMVLTLKPQVGGLVLVGFLLRSLRQRDLGPVKGFAGIMAAAFAACFVMLPSWPWDWLAKIPDGHLFTQGSPAISFILLESGVSGPLALGIGIAIAAPPALWFAWRSWTAVGSPTEPAFIAFGIAANVPFAIYNHSYDYTLMLLPGLLVLTRLPRVPRAAVRRGIAAALLLAYLVPMGRYLHLTPESSTFLSGMILVAALYLTRDRGDGQIPGTPPAVRTLESPPARNG